MPGRIPPAPPDTTVTEEPGPQFATVFTTSSIEVITAPEDDIDLGAPSSVADPDGSVVKDPPEEQPTEAGVSVRLPDTAETEDPPPVPVEVSRRETEENGDTGAEPGDTTAEIQPGDVSEFLRDFDRAITLQRAGEYSKALEYYERYLDRRPGHASSYNNMGVIYQKKTKYDKAIECYSKAIAAEPGNHQTFNNLASCCIAEKRYERAVEALRQSLEVAEDNFPALVNLGVAETALGNYEGAEKTLLKATRLYPDEAQPYLNLANLYRLLDHRDRAAECYNRFLEKSDGRYAKHEAQVRKLLAEL